jgi:heat shock protein HtpX
MINQIKTVLLLGGLSGLFLLVGYFVGGPAGLTIGLIFAIGTNFFSYWFSDKIALKIYRAIPLDENKNPEIFQMTRDLCRSMKLPLPKLYIIPASYSNAFATGRSEKHASVALTEGIINLLSKEELKGVIAHELAHIKNKDILISSIAATIAAVISYVAFIARWGAIFGGFGDRDKGGGIIELLVLAIVAPLMATIIQLAISRSREFLADETGAKAMHSGHS